MVLMMQKLDGSECSSSGNEWFENGPFQSTIKRPMPPPCNDKSSIPKANNIASHSTSKSRRDVHLRNVFPGGSSLQCSYPKPHDSKRPSKSTAHVNVANNPHCPTLRHLMPAEFTSQQSTTQQPPIEPRSCTEFGSDRHPKTKIRSPPEFRSAKSLSYLFCVLVFISGIQPVVASGTGEWYHECTDGSCGHGSSTSKSSLPSSSKCRDDNEQCATYARMGECFANPGYMHVSCKRSCGLCQDDSDRDNDDACVDKHSNCQKWADEMECYVNPAYMSGACPATCKICVNQEELRRQGLPEDQIRERRKFAETDFGLWQSIPKDESYDAVRARVQNMGRYMRKLELDGRVGRGTVCNNQYHDCAKWAAAPTNACESNLDFMISCCSLVCEYCHVVEEYHTCRRNKRPTSVVPFHDTAAVRQHLMATFKEARNLLEGSCSVDNNSGDDSKDEWILSLNWHALWGDESAIEPKEEIMLRADDVEWLDAMDSSDPAAINFDGVKPMDRSGRIVTVSNQLYSRAPFQDFLSRISNTLMVPRQNLEVEFVRYQRGERHASHSDYRIHDSWKPSGSRVLSMYVVLQQPDKGGNFGFPTQDWLLIDNPEVLVWPNVHREGGDSGSLKPLPNLQNEQLPVVEGELYAAHIWVHEYSFDPNGAC